MDVAAEFAQAHGMSRRLKLQTDRVLPRMMVVLIPLVVAAAPICAEAIDGKPSPRAESSMRDNRATVDAVNIRNHQLESRSLPPELTISVFVFNSANIATHELMKAEVRAGEIFEKVGIKLIWVVDSTTRDAMVHSPGEAWKRSNLDLRIWTRHMTRGPAIPSDVLGYCLSMEHGQAVLLSDGIRDLANTWGKDTADLLGLAVAHEIGHLLLQSAGHPNIGLMQARYLQKDLVSFERGQLMFNRKESDCIRSEVRRRTSMQVRASSQLEH
jgi:hypothetical protein